MTTNNIRRLVGPNREMDAEIWRRAGMEGEAPPLTASVDAGLALINRLWPGLYVNITQDESCAWASFGEATLCGGRAPTPALALCAAIMDALDAEGR